jgi:hypothetical protein
MSTFLAEEEAAFPVAIIFHSSNMTHRLARAVHFVDTPCDAA